MNENLFPPKAGGAAAPKHDRTAWLKGGDATCVAPPRKPPGQVWRIIMLGAPGVGKGTQADLLSERLGCCHLSTGDVFRAARCSGVPRLSPAMQEAVHHMHRGELVPDTTVLDLVRERQRCLHCAGGFLLDGFPRTVAQAEALEKLLEQENVRLDVVLNFELSAEQVIARIAGRRTCSECKAVYHLANHAPKIAGRCDECGGELFQREDDRPEFIMVRMQTYEQSSQSLVEFYKQRGLLITISAEWSPEDIYQRTERLALTH